MNVDSILPIPGVPDDLIRVLNDRFRQLSGGGSPAAAAMGVGSFFRTKMRPDANGTTVGTFGTDTDTGLLYQVQTVRSAQVWVYAGGVVRAPFAGKPSPGVNDVGLLWSVTDYAHLMRWMGNGWEFVDAAGGYIAGLVVAPDGAGWQACNGNGTTYLHLAAGVVWEVAFTTPNLMGVPAYLKMAGSTSGIIPASNATIPQGTGTTFTALAATFEPAHLNLLPYFRR